jgi:hypothetical protein
MSCPCDFTIPLELTRASISKRSKESRKLKRALDPVADHPDREHQLLKCVTCERLWQRASAWNWGGKEYFFIVPNIEVAEWRERPFVDPDELLLWAVTLDRFVRGGGIGSGSSMCREAGCERMAIDYSVLCLRHHIENLQSVRALPQTPAGRFFPPYDQLAPDRLEEWLSECQHRIEPVA